MTVQEVLDKLHFNQAKSSVLVELVGTFLLVLTVSLASNQNGELAPLAAGFMLMALVFAFGYISGAHFNPAVTFAAYFCHREEDQDPFPWYTAVLYAIAQLLGASGAGIYMLFIVGFDFPVPVTQNAPLAVVQGFFAESVYTFVLASVVMHVALSSQRQNDFYGFAIGMAVMSAAFAVGGVSGGAFNPAVATGLIVVKCLVGARCTAMIHLWMYWVAELVGALVAVILYNSVTLAMAEGNKKPPVAAAAPASPAKAVSAAANASGEDAKSPAPLPPAVNPHHTGDADDREMNESTFVGGSGSPKDGQKAAAPVPIRPMPTISTTAATPTKPEAAAASPSPAPPAEDKKKNPDDVSPLDVDDEEVR